MGRYVLLTPKGLSQPNLLFTRKYFVSKNTVDPTQTTALFTRKYFVSTHRSLQHKQQLFSLGIISNRKHRSLKHFSVIAVVDVCITLCVPPSSLVSDVPECSTRPVCKPCTPSAYRSPSSASQCESSLSPYTYVHA